MTISVHFYGFAYCFYNISRRPAALISQGYALTASPVGKLFLFYSVVTSFTVPAMVEKTL